MIDRWRIERGSSQGEIKNERSGGMKGERERERWREEGRERE